MYVARTYHDDYEDPHLLIGPYKLLYNVPTSFPNGEAIAIKPSLNLSPYAYAMSNNTIPHDPVHELGVPKG